MYTTQWYLEQWGLWTFSGTGIPVLNNPKERKNRHLEISDDEALLIDRAVARISQLSTWKSKVIGMYFRWNKSCLDISHELGYKSSRVGWQRVQEAVDSVESVLIDEVLPKHPNVIKLIEPAA